VQEHWHCFLRKISSWISVRISKFFNVVCCACSATQVIIAGKFKSQIRSSVSVALKSMRVKRHKRLSDFVRLQYQKVLSGDQCRKCSMPVTRRNAQCSLKSSKMSSALSSQHYWLDTKVRKWWKTRHRFRGRNSMISWKSLWCLKFVLS
jgi:hypothetical protein